MKLTFPDMPPPPKPPSIFSLADPDRFAQEMAASGFEDVEIHEVVRVSEFSGAQQAWELSTTGAPPAIAMRRAIGKEGMAQLKDTYIQALSERFGDGPVAFSNTALVAVGRRRVD